MIDFTKPVQTRDGRTVRILCTDANNGFPVVALVSGKRSDPLRSDREFLVTFQKDGSHTQSESDLDLVQAPVKHTRWGVWWCKKTDPVTMGPRFSCYLTEFEARNLHSDNIILSVVEITYTEEA